MSEEELKQWRNALKWKDMIIADREETIRKLRQEIERLKAQLNPKGA
ncbi:hypothetical protein [Paenibacillus lactis]